MLPILHQSIWRDEAFSLLLSLKSPLQIIQVTARDASPPFFYILLHYWLQIFGNNEVVARSLPFLLHVFTACAVFFAARKLVLNYKASTVLFLAVLFNPFLVQYAFEIRPYTLLALLTVASFYFLISGKRILAGFFLALTLFTHNFALFNICAFALWFLYSEHKQFRIRRVIEFAFFPVIAFSLWESIIWAQWIKVAEGFWIKPATSSIFLHTLEKFATGDVLYPTQNILFLFSFILLSLAIGYWVQIKKPHDTKIMLVSLLVFIPILITYLISALFSSIYHERYLIASLPFLILLVGYSVARLYGINTVVRPAILIILGMYGILLIQSSEYMVNIITKPAINYAVDQVLQQAQPRDIIIPQSNLNYLETLYYVTQRGKNIPVYVYAQDGKIPFYIGAVLFEKSHLLTAYPKNQRIWEIIPDGGYRLRVFH